VVSQAIRVILDIQAYQVTPAILDFQAILEDQVIVVFQVTLANLDIQDIVE
jgi:hypothetical protein